MFRPARAALAAAVIGASVVAGCSGPAVPAGSCGSPRHELLDIRSTQHLLPGAPEPPYSTDPPTSGAHRVGYYPRGVVASTIGRPTQVALLEKGFVIIQYRPDPGAAATLAPLASVNPYVTIAPDPTLPYPVVATSWLNDVRCGSATPASVAALRNFITRRVGQGTEPTIPLNRTALGGTTTTSVTAP